MKEVYKSRIYTDRPTYADFDAPAKFQAIQSIVGRRLVEHPNAICSYSGGSDSDIMIDVIERARTGLGLPPIKYVFFNTGLEMKATKDHVKATAEKYGVEIEECRPKVNIVMAVRKYGVPFLSKIDSDGIDCWQRHPFQLDIQSEYQTAQNKPEKYRELCERYPKRIQALKYICSCNSKGEPAGGQLSVSSSEYLLDFLRECPPDFQISRKCCDYCKKRPAHRIQKGYDMIITGERRAEGGARSVGNGGCFEETASGQFRLRPLYYVTDADKDWYKGYYDIQYSDAYEVYGLTRTGCCGCPISSKAVEDLERIRSYEPNVVKAAWNIFGDSYRYRQEYNKYKAFRIREEKVAGQMSLFDGADARLTRP